MKINAAVEPMKYNEHRGFNDSEYRDFKNMIEHNGKQNNDENVSFSEILKQVKRVKKHLYSK